MKLTISIAVCTLMVMLQQMQAPMALSLTPTQSCGNPKCSSGSVDTNKCKCSATYPSTCPSGFTEIVNPHGLCSCEKKVKPQCPSGFYINSACTLCTIDTKPKCPSGSSVIPSTARCKGTAKPKCPSGFTDHGGCKCVKEYVRQCSSGKLSWNGCSCTGWGTSKPTCGYGCHLNWSNCRCYKYGGGNDCCRSGICPCFLEEPLSE